MSAHDNGGPAFPYGVRVIRREGYGDGERTIDENEVGMTLRDYFAAAVIGHLVVADVRQDFNTEQDAAYAYKVADAMLKERAK
jgi:hypothetical protein